jgi:phage baseplate assembly protein V
MLQDINEQNWDIKDIAARLERMVQYGEVAEMSTDGTKARVLFPALGGNSLWLKVGVRRALGASQATRYQPGEQVTCLMVPVGDVSRGTILCANHNASDLPWTDSPDIEGIKYADGTEFSYDMENGKATLSLLDGSVAMVATKEGWVFKGKVTFEDEAHFNEAVNCDKTLDAKDSISSQAELSDSKGALSQVREQYNDHDHEYDDGTTGKPNQKM